MTWILWVQLTLTIFCPGDGCHHVELGEPWARIERYATHADCLASLAQHTPAGPTQEVVGDTTFIAEWHLWCAPEQGQG